MQARRAELRNYVELAASTLRPLYERDGNETVSRLEALRLLGSLNYGEDGYFFVYDLNGTVLMHSRQPELVGRNLWDLRDPQGRLTIQELVAQARAGGGYVDYLWRKPSTAQVAPKLGHVIALERWHWMLGTGLYLDDIQAVMAQLDREASANITTTLVGITGMAVLGVALISAAGLLLNLSEYRVADTKLRLMARQVVQSQEDERAHLARELNDGTSQALVSSKLLVESVAAALEKMRAPAGHATGPGAGPAQCQPHGDTPHLPPAAAGPARHPGPAGRAGAPGQRVRRAGHGRGERGHRRTRARAAGGGEDGVVPHRPGGPDQHRQARPGGPGGGAAALWRRGRRGAAGHRRRPGLRQRGGAQPS